MFILIGKKGEIFEREGMAGGNRDELIRDDIHRPYWTHRSSLRLPHHKLLCDAGKAKTFLCLPDSDREGNGAMQANVCPRLVHNIWPVA